MGFFGRGRGDKHSGRSEAEGNSSGLDSYELDVDGLVSAADDIARANMHACDNLMKIVASGRCDSEMMAAITQASAILAAATASIHVLLAGIIDMNEGYAAVKKELDFRRSLDALDGE